MSDHNSPILNAPEMSVSDLSLSLKRTLEDAYGYVRVRGELSRVKIHTSGHMYSDLKDDKSVINAVCWRGTVSKLSVRPEEGLEVICTGRISTYPARSNYQLVIESMELAGEGALLKMLEERKKKLAEEGLFAPERKKNIPFLPAKIGVVTSPTGAVIRDILHRLSDRFPLSVLLWPVNVQGKGAEVEIADAVKGFNDLEGAMRPDVLIVARGGGSLEDLMAFNEECVVRAVAESAIPVISAVGHETDTTLIDYASDLRAPTPTGAAEMAVPERVHLLAQLRDDALRLDNGVIRYVSDLKNKLDLQTSKLGDPAQLLENKMQSLDFLSDKLLRIFERHLSLKHNQMIESSAKLRHPKDLIRESEKILSFHTGAFNRLQGKMLLEPEQRLGYAVRMLENLSFERILDRGFVVVRDDEGHVVSDAKQTKVGQNVVLQFKGDNRREAMIGGAPKSDKNKKKKENKQKNQKITGQGQLF